jgi:hypothetical protein
MIVARLVIAVCSARCRRGRFQPSDRNRAQWVLGAVHASDGDIASAVADREHDSGLCLAPGPNAEPPSRQHPQHATVGRAYTASATPARAHDTDNRFHS